MTATVAREPAERADGGGGRPNDPGSDGWRRRRLHRRWRRMALAVGMVLALVGAVKVGRSLTDGRLDGSWQAEISWTMWGPVASTGDPVTPVSHVDEGPLTGDRRAEVTYTDGGRFTVDLGPSSVDHIEITDFSFQGATVVHLESISTSPALSNDLTPRRTPMRPFDPADRGDGRRVHFTFAFDSCRNSMPGSWIVLDEVTVTYRGHGRVRHQQVPLPEPIAIVFPEGCG